MRNKSDLSLKMECFHFSMMKHMRNKSDLKEKKKKEEEGISRNRTFSLI